MTISRVYLLDGDDCDGERLAALDRVRLYSSDDVSAALVRRGRALWVLCHRAGLGLLRAAMLDHRTAGHRLLLLEEVPRSSMAVLEANFDRVVSPPVALLPRDELAEVLASDNRADHCVGGIVDPGVQAITLYRGDLSVVTVPLGFFTPSGDGTAPNFRRFQVTDHGRTLKFGAYEAAFDDVLYEHDPVFRRKLQAQRLKEDQSLGASVRRLRKQRGLRQGDFSPLSAKTIARIERGEVSEIQERTRAIIAGRLGVPPGDLATW